MYLTTGISMGTYLLLGPNGKAKLYYTRYNRKNTNRIGKKNLRNNEDTQVVIATPSKSTGSGQIAYLGVDSTRFFIR